MLQSLFAFRKPIPRRLQTVLGVFGFALFLGLWQITAVSGVIRPEFLPTPLSVVEAFGRLFIDRDFASDIVISVTRVWVAFLLSVVIAVPLGLYMSAYRAVGAILEPFIDFVRYLPVPALVPLLVIWFGVGETSKIAVLWMGTFFQLILLIAVYQLADGIQNVSVGILRGIQDVKIIMPIAFLSYIVFNLPVGYLLGFTLGMGAQGLILGFTVGLTTAAVLLIVRYRRDIRRWKAGIR